MLREKADDLQRVHVADDAKASAPRTTVPIAAVQQIPPELHLRRQRWTEGCEDIGTVRLLGRIPHVTGVFVRVAIVTSGGRRIVGKQAAVGKRLDGAIDQR